MEWPNEVTYELLNLYKLEEIIWNRKNVDHKNKSLISDAWKNIQKKLSKDMSVVEIKLKVEDLMDNYKTLHQKVQQSKKCGIKKKKLIYKPLWFCYDFMDEFLHDVYEPRETTDTEDSDFDSPLEDSKAESDSNTEPDDLGGTISRNKRKKSFKCPLKRKRISGRSSFDLSVDELLDKTFTTLKTQLSHDDICTIYEKHFAIKFKQFDPQTREHIKTKIENILFVE